MRTITSVGVHGTYPFDASFGVMQGTLKISCEQRTILTVTTIDIIKSVSSFEVNRSPSINV